jgi:hypothetical protein
MMLFVSSRVIIQSIEFSEERFEEERFERLEEDLTRK